MRCTSAAPTLACGNGITPQCNQYSRFAIVVRTTIKSARLSTALAASPCEPVAAAEDLIAASGVRFEVGGRTSLLPSRWLYDPRTAARTVFSSRSISIRLRSNGRTSLGGRVQRMIHPASQAGGIQPRANRISPIFSKELVHEIDDFSPDCQGDL
jgi:hypothetical protein